MSNYKELSFEELQRLASQGNRDAYYWLGVHFTKRGDNQNTAMWWEKAVKELPSSHEGFRGAALGLAVMHKNKEIINADDNEAIRLFELVPKLGPLGKLLLGMLYYDVQGQKNNPSKGIGLVEDAITQYNKEDGNDEDIDYGLCYEIARVYYDYADKTNNGEYIWVALEYFGKTVARGMGSPQAETAIRILEQYDRFLSSSVCYGFALVYLMEAEKTSKYEYTLKAMDYLRKTIERDPGSQDAEEAKKLLAAAERAYYS